MADKGKSLKSKYLAWAIFVSWLLVASYLLWAYFYKPYGYFFSEPELPGLSAETRLNAPGQRTFVHFIDQECSCTRFSLPHIEDVKAEHPDVQHIEARLGSESVNSKSQTQNALAQEIFDKQWVVATPAVAVIEADGAVAYFGPYSAGAICGEGEDLLKTVVKQLQADQNFSWYNLLSYGCFCKTSQAG